VFGANKIKCLGHVVGGGTVRPDPEKVSAILNLPPPKDVSGLRHFLGLTSYYREYLEDFAAISEPLEELTRKGREFVWTFDCQSAFDRIKEKLTTEPILCLPDFSKPFILTTNWSKCAIGAVLSQIDEDTNFDHPIAYASRLLNVHERKYSATEGECLALL
jgi:RNase H-like domain found in reverse transcriptase